MAGPEQDVPAPPRGKLRGCDGLLWREWDGEFVVFHPPSGDTHLLNAFAAEVLLSLAERPAGLPELMARLARDAGLEAGPEQEGQVAKLLARLQELGLVEPVTP